MGTVLKAKDQIIRTLNRIANDLARQAENRELQVDVHLIEDIADSIKAASVDVQVGLNRLFPDSQIIQVVVFDDDNVRVVLPTTVAKTFQVKNFNSFVSSKRAGQFLRKIYTKL